MASGAGGGCGQRVLRRPGAVPPAAARPPRGDGRAVPIAVDDAGHPAAVHLPAGAPLVCHRMQRSARVALCWRVLACSPPFTLIPHEVFQRTAEIPMKTLTALWQCASPPGCMLVFELWTPWSNWVSSGVMATFRGDMQVAYLAFFLYNLTSSKFVFFYIICISLHNEFFSKSLQKHSNAFFKFALPNFRKNQGAAQESCSTTRHLAVAYCTFWDEF